MDRRTPRYCLIPTCSRTLRGFAPYYIITKGKNIKRKNIFERVGAS
jgi:hypothetical protein